MGRLHIESTFDHTTAGAPVVSVAVIVHTHTWRVQTMCWPDPGEETAVKTMIQEDDSVAKRAAMLRA